MKNWCKIYEYKEFDVLLTKGYDDEARMVTLELTIYDDVNGITARTAFKYADETKRDEIFDQDDKEKIEGVALAMIKNGPFELENTATIP